MSIDVANSVCNKLKTPLVVALDYADDASALHMAQQLNPHRCRVKVGKELFTRSGPQIVRALSQRGFQVFLDLKFHDIPNTVANAVLAAAESGAWMINVHAGGGSEMMSAAVNALESLPKEQRPLLIAVTVLTSMSEEQLQNLGVARSLSEHVLALALSAKQAGMDGVVCSAQEAAEIKRVCGENFVTVTPGIRPTGSQLTDQKRVMTPSEAVANGSDYLVIGRPITQAENPMDVVVSIEKELDSAK